jgi:7,8-dihydropterin-6-yl-methyl-4-(beta-D-ribofuranosyl)aminobenzene 5'-phosphate synthase
VPLKINFKKTIMRVSVLTENQPGSFTPAEHGLSYLIEYDGIKILFDTGQNDMFLKNAEKMNVSMANIDKIVLSHGHFDHGNGLNYLSGSSLICHPGCFVRHCRKTDHTFIGLKNSQEQLSWMFNLTLSSEPVILTEKIYFLGEIPRLTDFESKVTPFILEDGTPDFVMDDSALVFILDTGLFVITGCGHSGIVNIIEYAKKITGISKISGIMGGFHLKEIDRQTRETIGYIKKENIKNILPSHCTELPALSAFYEAFGIRQVKTGDIYEF